MCVCVCVEVGKTICKKTKKSSKNNCDRNMSTTFVGGPELDWCQHTQVILHVISHNFNHFSPSTCEAVGLSREWWLEVCGRMITKKEKRDRTRSSRKAIVMNSISLEGWIGKLVQLPDTEVCGRVRWLRVGATGSGCLALVLDKHSVGRCQRLH